MQNNCNFNITAISPLGSDNNKCVVLWEGGNNLWGKLLLHKNNIFMKGQTFSY